MSDIKYIIAAVDEEDQDEEQRCCSSTSSRRRRRPFPCLATVRYVAASVVAMLALTVTSMVIRAVLRSEDIRLSVNNGYVAADILWTTEVPPSSTDQQPDRPTRARAVGRPGDRRHRTTGVQLGASGDDRDLPLPTTDTAIISDRGGFELGAGDYYGSGAGFGVYPRTRPGCYLGCGPGDFGGDDENPPPSARQVTMKAARDTNLRVILIVTNPGGRTKVDCNRTAVAISDASNKHAIAEFELGNFTVQPQTTITLQKRVRINDTAVLGYIWERHGGRAAFGVVLRVTSSVASYPLGKMTEPVEQSYVCRSVTLGLASGETSLDAVSQRQGDCYAEKPTTQLAPAPAPAP